MYIYELCLQIYISSIYTFTNINYHAELVMLYRAHMLSLLEYRTPVLYHATCGVLRNLDRVQEKILDNASIGVKDGSSL